MRLPLCDAGESPQQLRVVVLIARAIARKARRENAGCAV
jgi:hypothetical protein